MKDNINLDEIYTEQRNPLTMHIDEESTEGIIRLMNGEDAKVALAVEKEIPNIVKAVDLITEAIRRRWTTHLLWLRYFRKTGYT